MKVGLGSSTADTGKGKSKMSKHITHGFHLVKGKSNHEMEDCLVSEFKQVEDHELGLFGIFDGHLGHDVSNYLKTHLFDNILKEVIYITVLILAMVFLHSAIFFSFRISSYEFGLFLGSISLVTCCKQHTFWTETENAIKRAYRKTDIEILDKSLYLGRGGSTAVTAILINGERLVVANVGDSRAVICKNGEAKQLSVDHEPSKERTMIERRGGFVSNLPGNTHSLTI